MASNQMQNNLNAGRTTFGLWVWIGNSFSAELLGRAGYDALILDAQHGGVMWDDVGILLQAVDSTHTTCLVRVPSTDPAGIMRALDLGAGGVIVPMVSNQAQARIAAQAMSYPPHGSRSFGMVRHYYAKDTQPAKPLCFVMIETSEALQNLDAIAAEPGIDGLFVGPVDLALSMGLGVVLEMHEEVLANIERVVAACKKHNKLSGSASIGIAYAKALHNLGVQFIAQGSDAGFLRLSAAAELRELHSLQEKDTWNTT